MSKIIHQARAETASGDHAVVQAAALALTNHRSHLDDLRPGPEYDAMVMGSCGL
jgi:hypothetical protein